MILKLSLLFIAGIFLAAMDTFENEKFFGSIFDKLNQKFWYKRESWKWVKRPFNYPLDSWHISKSCCFALIFVAMADFNVINAIIYWSAFFCAFNLFYHKLFRK